MNDYRAEHERRSQEFLKETREAIASYEARLPLAKGDERRDLERALALAKRSVAHSEVFAGAEVGEDVLTFNYDAPSDAHHLHAIP